MDNATGTEAPKTLDDEIAEIAEAVRETAQRWAVPQDKVFSRVRRAVENREGRWFE